MYKILAFRLAREALKYIIFEYKIKEINLPYYLCDVVRHTVFNTGCKIKFYHIDDDFMPAKNFDCNEYILYPNYFGIFGENVSKLALKYPKLIVDNAHAYYDKPLSFACFNAGHKFGYKNSILWIQSDNKTEEKIQINQEKKRIIQEKFFYLCSKYNSQNLLKFSASKNYVPYVYPYLAESEEEADILVKKLVSKGQTIYRYWNSLPKSYNEYKFYSRLVPIPLAD